MKLAALTALLAFASILLVCHANREITSRTPSIQEATVKLAALHRTLSPLHADSGMSVQPLPVAWGGGGGPSASSIVFCVPIFVCSQCLRRKSCYLPGSGHCLTAFAGSIPASSCFRHLMAITQDI
jgi:hypothetical protein